MGMQAAISLLAIASAQNSTAQTPHHFRASMARIRQYSDKNMKSEASDSARWTM
jgi:hypothetical protein